MNSYLKFLSSSLVFYSLVLATPGLSLANAKINAKGLPAVILMRLPAVSVDSLHAKINSVELLTQSPPTLLKPKSDTEQKPSFSDEPKAKGLIRTEVVVKGASGKLQDEIYRMLRTKSGLATMPSQVQLQRDINSIYSMGYFSNVRVLVEFILKDKRSSIRFTFELIRANIILKSVGVENTKTLPPQVVRDAFQGQYGKTISLGQLKEGVERINKWYQNNGYVGSQVSEPFSVSENGIVTLTTNEVTVDSIKLTLIDKNKKENRGLLGQYQMLEAIINQKLKTKVGDAYNPTYITHDLQQFARLNISCEIVLTTRFKLESLILLPIKQIIKIDSISDNMLVEISLAWSSNKDFSARITLRERALVDYALTTGDKIFIDNLDDVNRLYYEAKKTERLAKSEPEKMQARLQVIEKYREIARLTQAQKNLPKYLEALIKTGDAYQSVNAVSQSIDFYTKALELLEKNSQAINSSDYFGEPNTSLILSFLLLVSLRLEYQSLGEYQQSLIYAQKLQILIQKASPLSKSDDTLESILKLRILAKPAKDLVYYDMGEESIGRESLRSIFKELIQLAEESGEVNQKDSVEQAYIKQMPILLASIFDGDSEVITRNTLNDTLKIVQHLEKVLSVYPKIKSIFDIDRPSLLLLIGTIYRDAGENEVALNAFYQAFFSYQQIEQVQIKLRSAASDTKGILKSDLYRTALVGKANSLKEIGTTLINLGRETEAIDSYQKALKLFQKLNIKAAQGLIFVEIGKVHKILGQYQAAIDSFNQALAIWREFGAVVDEANTRLEIARAELALNHLKEAQKQIETSIQLIEMEPPLLNELSQASTLAEQNQFQSYIKLASYFTARQYFYDFYINLLMQLHQQNPNQGYLVQAFQVSEQSHGRSLLAILSRRDRYISTKRHNLNGKRSQNLVRVMPLVEIQKQILDRNSILLEYALGEEHSYLWVISKTDIKSYQLPKRSEIEATSRRFYDFLTVPSLRVRSIKSAKAGRDLSQMLLGAASRELNGKRLLIVGDGILQYIPFTALPSPEPAQSGANEPLITQHEIVSMPSISTFAAFRSEYQNSPLPSKTIAVFADPVFGYTDDRITRKSTQPEPLKKLRPLVGSYQSPAEIFSDQIYPRLPSTQIEATEISNLVRPTDQLQRTGFAANRQAALDPSLNQYRILHFATHGTLDATRPERSGMLLSVLNQQGEPQRSLLSTPDTFNLNLSADLVVLSGCRTGLGKEIRGEGLVGLTGGLMYAGAKRVVVSLWSVDDQATAVLMSHFYKGILQEKLPPAQALRNAQLEVRKDPRWQNPFYWAGFILQGEWK